MKQLYLVCFSMCSFFLMSGQAMASAHTAAGAMPTSTMNELLKQEQADIQANGKVQADKVDKVTQK